jgi:formylglycine-generating enzyme required for sulfatase activity
MVYVPAGKFRMGSNLCEIETAFASASAKFMVSWIWFERELFQYEHFLPAFWVDAVPVTCARYLKFCSATGHKRPEYWKNGEIPAGKENHPVVQVDWADCVAYCAWAGKRLPYEAEWEKAARGADGRIWPWGNEFRPDCGNIRKGVSTEPVGSYPLGASPFGCLDMAGNVFQWTRDLNVPYPSYLLSEEARRTCRKHQSESRCSRTVIFVDGGSQDESEPFQFFGCIARGGGYGSCPEHCRTSFRYESREALPDIGFRCVLGEDPSDKSRDLGDARKFEEALQWAERSLAISPNYPTALYNAANALEQLGRTADAADRYDRLVRVWPTDHSTLNKLAMCCWKLGHATRALDAVHAAIDIKPEDVDYWYNKANMLHELGARLLQPHALVRSGGTLMIDSSKVPTETLIAYITLEAEAVGCLDVAKSLGAEDPDLLKLYNAAKQSGESHIRGLSTRLDAASLARAKERIDLATRYPLVQLLWSIVLKYLRRSEFSAQDFTNRGFSESAASTGLMWLQKWGQVESTGGNKFRVCKGGSIAEHEPWRAAAALLP